MYIKSLNTVTGAGEGTVTITLTYGDIRDISNACYKAHQGLPYTADNKPIHNAYANMKFAFDMIKHGKIQPETIKEMNLIQQLV